MTHKIIPDQGIRNKTLLFKCLWYFRSPKNYDFGFILNIQLLILQGPEVCCFRKIFRKFFKIYFKIEPRANSILFNLTNAVIMANYFYT